MELLFDSQHRPQFLLSEPSGHVVGLTPSSTTWAPMAVPQRIKQPGCKADHLPLSSAEIKNVWSYTFTPLTFIYVVLKKNFTFSYTASHPT